MPFELQATLAAEVPAGLPPVDGLKYSLSRSKVTQKVIERCVRRSDGMDVLVGGHSLHV
jgi:hypothetical protein